VGRVSVLVRLSDQNLAQVEPPAWVVFLLYSHPPVGQRIAAAQRIAQQK
jgi:Zn-dependent protease with chaperone function